MLLRGSLLKLVIKLHGMPRAGNSCVGESLMDGTYRSCWTGCDHTMVLASLVDPSVVDHVSKVPVLCVHGNTLFYPTATVVLRIGPWQERSWVIYSGTQPSS